MRIFIITMDDPVFTIDFVKDIIRQRKEDIIGVAIARGERLKIGKRKSKFKYLLSLLLIMGIPHFVRHAYRTVSFKLRKNLAGYGLGKSPSLAVYTKELGIPVMEIGSPNHKDFLKALADLQPDIIINQSQYILKKQLLDIPKIGVLNRHNALLPKNRGRLTPFWVVYRGERQTGVSVHFVREGIDDGPVVVQEPFTVEPKDTFNTIVRKNYAIASCVMLKALSLLETNQYTLMENRNEEATYNSIPTLPEAWEYRKKIMFR
jgi:methionyl-tRNA formyltransferase